MKNKLNNNNGFTLVEIIIAFAIFAVMAIFVATSISAANRSYLDTQAMNRKTDNQNIAANSALLINTSTTDQKMNAAIEQITIGNTSDVTSSVDINVDFYEKDKQAIDDAIAAPTPTDDQKKLIRDKDAPNLKYAKLP